ncbi:MAG: hypothetical protein MUC88_07880 [Planctomycetes bacterium]|nr:hypothetical protein [Planctomycetota bacterium]
MKTRYSTILTVGAALLTLGLAASSAPAAYTMFNGWPDSVYDMGAKYAQWGMLNALDALGVPRSGYWHGSPAYFYENSFIPNYWTYSPPEFDSRGADGSAVTVYNGPTGTLWDCAGGGFFALLGMRDSWNGLDAVVSRNMRIGEAPGELYNDAYSGTCRYLILLGNDTVALGPAMWDEGYATFSHPDWSNSSNPMHADPFLIWKPVMTSGVRMVMGLTSYQILSNADQASWKRFADYRNNMYSLAESFAYTALDANPGHMPIVLVQAASYDSCHWMLDQERDFLSARPAGSTHYIWRSWGLNRARTYGGYYVWCSAGAAQLQSQMKGLKDKTAAGTARQAAWPKEVPVLGYTDGARTRTLGGTDNPQQLWVDPATDSVYYRKPQASERASGPCTLTEDESLRKAAAFVAEQGLAPLEELAVDGVVTITDMLASAAEIAARKYSHQPQTAGYIVTFKRDLGALPILGNQTDTVQVEIGADGEVASAVSTYRETRTFAKQRSITPKFATLQAAREKLVRPGVAGEVTAGYFPTADGVYVPVYKVLTLRGEAASPSAEVQYLRMDTLEPVADQAALTEGPVPQPAERAAQPAP